MPPPLTIRILGAGVSGLASAIALAADGHRVELLDESFDIPTVGTALALFGSAQKVLRRLGVLDEVRAHGAAPREGGVRASDGRILATIPAGGAVLVPRSHLVRILQEALPDSVRRTPRRVQDVRPLRDGADLLIGADGAHSLVRRSGWPGRTAARAHGVTVLRGTADLAPPDISETWGRGWLFGITPLSAGHTNWFACVPEHRTPGIAHDLAHLQTIVVGHRDEIDAVLAAATPEQTLVHGIHTAPLLIPVRENVVLLGDAAHAMAPNLGHGANTALQDADALAASLRQCPDGPADPARRVELALRRMALRRTVPGQGWRIASSALLRVAMADERAGLRDRLLGRVGALSSASGRGS